MFGKAQNKTSGTSFIIDEGIVYSREECIILNDADIVCETVKNFPIVLVLFYFSFINDHRERLQYGWWIACNARYCRADYSRNFGRIHCGH